MTRKKNAPFVANSPTSFAAAAAITSSGKQESIARRVFAAIEISGSAGMTCQEVEAELGGLKHQSCSPRVNELASANCIQRTDTVRNGSYVYIAVPGATFDRFAQWQRTSGTKAKKKATSAPAPSAVIEISRISDPEQEVITRAKLYARTYWENRPPAEIDAARNWLLDAARYIAER